MNTAVLLYIENEDQLMCPDEKRDAFRVRIGTEKKEKKKRDAYETLIYICNETEDGLLMMQRGIKGKKLRDQI